MDSQRQAEPVGQRLMPDDPTSVGGYEILSKLGEGGMGAVYLGQGPDARRVAVKVVRPELARDPAFLARFQDEVANAGRVASFCTAAVLAHGEDAGRAYMVTEYIDGPSLMQHVAANGALSPGLLHGVAVGVAAALVAIHSEGLVHRDLKPSNVLLSITGPRVIDFGIARALDVGSSHTRTGQVIGSPGWIAPEQILNQHPGTAVDIFAWGCLVAFAGNGRHPFGTGSFEIMAARVVHAEPDIEGLSPTLLRLVSRALDRDPANRPTAQELLLALVGGGGGEAAVSTTLHEAWQEPLAPAPQAPPGGRHASPPAGTPAYVPMPPAGPAPGHSSEGPPPPYVPPAERPDQGPAPWERTQSPAAAFQAEEAPARDVTTETNREAGTVPARGLPVPPGPGFGEHTVADRGAAAPLPYPTPYTDRTAPSRRGGRRTGVLVAGAVAALVLAGGGSALGWTLMSGSGKDKNKSAGSGSGTGGPSTQQTPKTTPGALTAQQPLLVRVDTAKGWPAECHGDIGLYDMATQQIKTLVGGSACDILPQWSKDRKSIAFTRRKEGTSEIWVMNADGSNQRKVISITGTTRVAWSPDGTRLAYTDGPSDDRQIYATTLDGNASKLTTSSTKKDDPTWSRDGRLAFWAGPAGGINQIYYIDPDRPAKETQVTNTTSAPDGAGDPVWSSDSKRIAFTLRQKDGGGDIAVINADGTGYKRLTNTSDKEMDPDWSPDGKWLAFVRGATENPRVWFIRPDGTGAQPLKPANKMIGHPYWS